MRKQHEHSETSIKQNEIYPIRQVVRRGQVYLGSWSIAVRKIKVGILLLYNYAVIVHLHQLTIVIDGDQGLVDPYVS